MAALLQRILNHLSVLPPRRLHCKPRRARPYALALALLVALQALAAGVIGTLGRLHTHAPTTIVVLGDQRRGLPLDRMRAGKRAALRLGLSHAADAAPGCRGPALPILSSVRPVPRKPAARGRLDQSTTLASVRVGYRITPRMKVAVDAFNLFDRRASDIDYFYTSRRKGEPAADIDDIHFHPVEPRRFRLTLTSDF